MTGPRVGHMSPGRSAQPLPPAQRGCVESRDRIAGIGTGVEGRVQRAWPDGGVAERRAQVGACPEEVGPGRGALGGRGVLGGAAL